MTQVRGDGKVDVQGLGALPEKFYARFDGANFNNIGDKKHPASNCHNESWTVVSCDRNDTWANDEIELSGYGTGDGYVFEIAVDSESSVKLWDRGRVLFTYSENDKRWGMKGFVKEGLPRVEREWEFFCAAGAIERIAAAINCYAAEKPGEDADTVLNLVASITEQSDKIVEGVLKYSPVQAMDSSTNITYAAAAMATDEPPVMVEDACVDNGSSVKTSNN